ncbi:Holliday junction branch migration protein RuvA [Curvivirga aplysinae]|uniref:Holliday junction branch migration protein RuvA n=1 Tax=Curvivirga aplysinae TaxID=2529852 RepID=UPI002E261A3D|nr:Holliday junction branch migration protein RuvA [Curvivirga aplysinae]
MISMLKGLVDTIAEDYVVLDVNGVGYQAFCSRRTLSQMPSVGEATRLEIETHVREDHIHLYGFIDEMERDWFKLLTTVQGVGARVCLAILSVLGPDELVQAIAAQDKAAVARANGVGPKLAGRIVLELKDKVAKFSLGGAALADKKTAAKESTASTPAANIADDAVSALVNLGYGRSDAYTAVVKAAQAMGDAATVEALIPAALKELSQ